MIMNNNQNTRSYNPVSVDSPMSQAPRTESSMEKLKTMVREQIEHEAMCALAVSDLADAYWKMGLTGHECKLHCISCEEFKEHFDWKLYYHKVFSESPRIELNYKTMDPPKSIDEIHSKMYELHSKSLEHMEEILKLIDELHLHEDSEIIYKAYEKTACYKYKLENKMRRVQYFGHDVAYILSKDSMLRYKYKKKHHEDKRRDKKH